MSVFVWVMIGVALWHFAVLVPDRFYGGIIGALIAAVAGALISGYLLPFPGVPAPNPPGMTEALWPIPGSIIALRRNVRVRCSPGVRRASTSATMSGDLGSRHSGAGALAGAPGTKMGFIPRSSPRRAVTCRDAAASRAGSDWALIGFP